MSARSWELQTDAGEQVILQLALGGLAVELLDEDEVDVQVVLDLDQARRMHVALTGLLLAADGEL